MSATIARTTRRVGADLNTRDPGADHGDPYQNLWKSLIGLIALASLATGCTTLGPDYKKPEAEVSQQWIDIDAPRLNSRPADLADWWTVFNDPVLNSLVAMAYTQNLTLRIA
ncbi:MAG: hypothetical protein OET44_09495, partial [Gammaproteobacteria bacterium]|nr:hypothetical protein [Gammaproteobacteria bacterium]